MARSYHNDLADLAAARYDRIARGNASPAQDDPIDHLDGSGEDQDRWEGVRGREGPEYFRHGGACLLYTSPSPRDRTRSRMPSSA